MAKAESLRVELVYALPQEQTLLRLELAPGTTLREAITQCGILGRYPQLDPATLKAGIFGRVVALEQPLATGDRVEIYRPLQADPKAARRARARKR